MAVGPLPGVPPRLQLIPVRQPEGDCPLHDVLLCTGCLLTTTVVADAKETSVPTWRLERDGHNLITRPGVVIGF